jgi:uncharacterized protein YraI
MILKTSMTSRLRLLLAFALASCMQLAAAETAIITRSANVRSSPNIAFPTVTWLLTGTRVTVSGCVSSWRWCEVVAGRDRGWVYSRYLSMPFQGSAITILDAGPALGLPVVDFALGPYWGEHYEQRLWFAQKAAWQLRWDQLPAEPEWREPAGRR